MKIKRYFLMLAAAAGVLSACTKLEEVQVLPIEDATAPVLHALPAQIEITKDNQADEITFTWDAADFGAKTEIHYTILASRDDVDNAPRLAIFSGISGTSYKFTKEALNGKMSLLPEDGGLGIPVNEFTKVHFAISATIGTNYGAVVSDVCTAEVKPTDAEKVYPNIWVIGDYCGWDHGKSQFLYSFTKDEVNYEGVVDFGEKAKNGFKFTGAAGWDNGNWGLEAESADVEPASLQLWSDGGSKNIMGYSKRFYKFTFNKTSLVLSKVFAMDVMGVIGDGANGWGDADDIVMNFNPAKRRFWADVDLKNGGIKFRADHGWALSWGTKNQDGKLDGGDNISVTAGKVRVYVYLSDTNDMKYVLDAKAYNSNADGDVPGPEPEPEYDWFYHGQTTEFPEWADIGMAKDGDDYKATVTVDAAQEFLLMSGDKSQWIAGVSASNPINERFATLGTDAKKNIAFAAAGTYDIWYFPATNQAMIAQKVADKWGLVGTVNKWGGMPDLYFSEESGLLVRKGVVLAATDEIKVRFNDEWNDAKNYGFAAEGTSITVDTPMDLIAGSGSKNMKAVAGTYDIWFDQANAKFYVLTPGKTPATL